ncbi:MAG TPA: alpha-2-macroglobulin family protein [Leptospiraceae bacterium]|nr:alpha-2-macroglobulin family protein [Leptospiraceae bacterium]HMX34863.1 alpha-2-macroglobulin family protein [Leptospiraceae bacterium]HMY30148.1 alpha-2-macroglobulin family protein [Leptospiraceae bacterium]HNA06603.1 alpha-2-macroglobulin family protein [Leptospiraceae bacterium]HNB99193.1 alpha-2-macroglobulin family protein [Leptospiraceae bacterium]
MINRIFQIIIFLSFCLFPFVSFADENSTPEFYLSTDKSFSKEEMPYVNLEGPGNLNYSIRVYEIADPEKFLQEKVKERLVKVNVEKPAFADPIQALKDAFNFFKNDFRNIARKELNTKTRSSISKGLKLDYKPIDSKNIAIPGILKEHKLVTSFSVPKSKQRWSYKRVPVPLKDSGVYLVEAFANSHLAYSLVLKSNLHFVTKLSKIETLVYVADKRKGSPKEKANIKIWDNSSGELIADGKTDSNGIYLYKGKTQTKNLILVNHENQYAISDPSFYSSSFYSEGGVKAYIYTERPVYRPGDDVFFKGIVRNFKKDSYFVTSGKASLDVFTSNGESILTGMEVNLSQNGTFEGSFKAPEGENVFLGVYNLVLNYEGKTYATEFSVDAYRKPTFLVKVKPEKQTYIKGEKIKFDISANYYHGMPLSGTEVEYQIFRKAKYDYSPVGSLNWEGTDAYLTSKESSGRREFIKTEKGTLDKSGSLSSSFIPDDVSQDFIYTIIASVRDSDMTLTGASSFSVNRSAIFIRIKKENQVFEPGAEVSFSAEAIAYDKSLAKEDLEKEIGNRKIKATIFKRRFQGISQEAERKKIDSFSQKTNEEGKAQFKFSLADKGHFLVRLETEDRNGAETFTETTIWSSAKSDSIEIPLKDLSLNASKDIYSIGDTAEILILSPVADANLLLTLEGNRILKYETISMKGNSLKYSIKITPDLSPNFTLSAVLFANLETYSGQIKVVAPPENKIVKVKIKSDRETYKPGETVQLQISTTDLKQNGIKTELSVAVVDEAIYQIQEDKNPSLISYFYHPRRNDVNTVYSSAYRFFGYSESRRMDLAFAKKKNLPLSVLKEDDSRSRERFKDTAFWLGTVTTDSDGNAKVQFNLPDNLTSWRVTTIALTEDSKFGQNTYNFTTRKPISLQANLPPYLLRGEKQSISTTVTNFTNQKEEVVVNLEARGVKIDGEQTKKITLKAHGSEVVSFSVQAEEVNNTKSASLKFSIKGKFEDSVLKKVPLKFFGLKKIESVAMKIPSNGQKDKATLKLPNTATEEQLTLRFHPGNIEALRASLPYLIDYPYGCVEQTMSRFVPVLAAQKSVSLSLKQRDELPKMAAQGIKNLKTLLGSEGGFKWFSRDSLEDSMMTAYVYRALSIAKKLNTQVPEELLNQSRNYLYKVLETTSDPFQKAYIIFSLSEGGEVEKSLIDSLISISGKQKLYGKALTGLAAFASGQKDQAQSIYKKIISESGIYKGKIPKFEADIENDDIETISAILLLAVRLNDLEISESLSEELLNRKVDIAWKNSRDTGMAVLALAEKLEVFSEKLIPINLQIKVNGKDFKSISIKPTEILSGKSEWNFNVSSIAKGDNTIELIKEKGNTVYAIASLEYVDRSKNFNSFEKGIKVKREYFSVLPEEKSGKTLLTAKNANSFKPGELVMVSIEVERSGKSDTYFMVEDPLIPGFSFVTKDTNYYIGEYSADYESRQIYDDRAVFFIRGPAQKTIVRYFLRSDMSGNYNVPPAKASLMYYPEIMGNSSSQNLKVE